MKTIVVRELVKVNRNAGWAVCACPRDTVLAKDSFIYEDTCNQSIRETAPGRGERDCDDCGESLLFVSFVCV